MATKVSPATAWVEILSTARRKIFSRGAICLDDILHCRALLPLTDEASSIILNPVTCSYLRAVPSSVEYQLIIVTKRRAFTCEYNKHVVVERSLIIHLGNPDFNNPALALRSIRH